MEYWHGLRNVSKKDLYRVKVHMNVYTSILNYNLVHFSYGIAIAMSNNPEMFGMKIAGMSNINNMQKFLSRWVDY